MRKTVNYAVAQRTNENKIPTTFITEYNKQFLAKQAYVQTENLEAF